ncbi:WcaI family glycosyltransferase, partial [Rhodoblastus sp.]|uniref:WcaI family glycosyltransferase n=1 Tax=Rhodoblastus sp. TaxID=1962975 RepID=UPI003F9A2B81
MSLSNNGFSNFVHSSFAAESVARKGLFEWKSDHRFSPLKNGLAEKTESAMIMRFNSRRNAENSLRSPRPPIHLLIQAINYVPEPIGCAKYTSELAEYMAKRGYVVEVISAVPHYPGWQVRPPFRAWRYAIETLNDVRVTHCPIIVKRNSGGAWRMIAPLSFALSAAPILLWRMLRFRPNVVLCVEPTLLASPVPVLLAKLIGARTFLHVQDLEVDAAFRVGHLKGRWLRKVGEVFERFLLRRFDRIITISGKMRSALIQKGVDSEDVEVIRNWLDIRAISPTHYEGQNPYRRQLEIDDRTFVVLYSGHIGAKQALHVLLDAARLLQDDGNILFIV